MLNVPSTVAAEVIANVEDLAKTDTTEVTREEVEVGVRKLQDGKAPGSNEIVAELVKNREQVMVDWLWELLREVWRTKSASRVQLWELLREVWRTKSASRVQECHPDPTAQEAKQDCNNYVALLCSVFQGRCCP